MNPGILQLFRISDHDELHLIVSVLIDNQLVCSSASSVPIHSWRWHPLTFSLFLFRWIEHVFPAMFAHYKRHTWSLPILWAVIDWVTAARTLFFTHLWEQFHMLISQWCSLHWKPGSALSMPHSMLFFELLSWVQVLKPCPWNISSRSWTGWWFHWDPDISIPTLDRKSRK